MGQLPNFPWNVSSGAACMLYCRVCVINWMYFFIFYCLGRVRHEYSNNIICCCFLQFLERELENDSSSEIILDILKQVLPVKSIIFFKCHTYLVKYIETVHWITELETTLTITMVTCFQTCLHPLCCKHPPSVRYRRLFLSLLIKRVSSDIFFVWYHSVRKLFTLVLVHFKKAILTRFTWIQYSITILLKQTTVMWCFSSLCAAWSQWEGAPGWALWCTGWSPGGRGGDRVLQELFTGTTHTHTPHCI